ncbi:DUF6283 family protein [Streptomyces griseus]
MKKLPRQKGPCGDCPWRRDVEPGQFDQEKYEELRETSRQPERIESVEDVIGQKMFACHQTKEGFEAACAGWLAVEGNQNLAVRFGVAMGRIPGDALSPGPDWPPLFGSFAEMEARQARRPDAS